MPLLCNGACRGKMVHMNANDYPRRILLAVTGLSPQIVTETLYGLAHDEGWHPTEIHLITTTEGAERARLTLLSASPGWFHRLRRDYSLPEIQFDADNIHILRRQDGTPLEDIRDAADNSLAADAMAELVRVLTADPQAQVHASIAGGRKTMGFYLGYAMSLYGRPQDELSHVLISAPFESNSDFYYPTPASHILYTHAPERRPIDAHDARISLARIPFVRLREGLPEKLLNGQARFSEVVAQAQTALPPLGLVLDPKERSITACGETFTLKPAHFAFYWWLSARRQQEQNGVHWSEDGIAEGLLAYYAQVAGMHSGEYVRAEQAFSRGFDQSNFEPAKAHVNRALTKALGKRRAEPYLITALEFIPGTRYHRFGLQLPSAAITVISIESGRE